MSPSFGRSWPIRPCVFEWRSSRRGRVSGHTRPASVCWCFPASVDTCCCWCVLLLEPVSSLWTVLYKANTCSIECMFLLYSISELYVEITSDVVQSCCLLHVYITSCFLVQFAFLKEQNCERESHIDEYLARTPRSLFSFVSLWVWCEFEAIGL